MRYEHRFIYAVLAFAFSFALGFFYDTQPLLNHISESRQLEKRLSDNLSNYVKKDRVQRKNAKSIIKKSPAEWLSDFLVLAQQYGLILQSLKFLPKKNLMNATAIHLILLSDFQQFLTFLIELEKQYYPIVLSNFHFQVVSNNRISLQMEMLILASETLHKPKIELLQLANPFCRGQLSHEFADDLVALKRTSLKQIRMVGYMRQDNRVLGLVMIPEGAVIALQQGMTVGKEQGVVERIFQHYILFLLPNRNRLELRAS